MKHELFHSNFDTDCFFALELLKLSKIAVANYLVGAMGKTEEKN